MVDHAAFRILPTRYLRARASDRQSRGPVDLLYARAVPIASTSRKCETRIAGRGRRSVRRERLRGRLKKGRTLLGSCQPVCGSCHRHREIQTALSDRLEPNRSSCRVRARVKKGLRVTAIRGVGGRCSGRFSASAPSSARGLQCIPGNDGKRRIPVGIACRQYFNI